MARTYQGGYDYELVANRTDQNYDCYMCMICQLLARDAYQARCCGKIYCEVCIVRLRESANQFSCPNCRQPLKDTLFKDTRVNREISSLMIYCVNKAKGCEWAGEIRLHGEHGEKCPKKEVECKNCKEVLLLDMLEDHSTTRCQKRSYTCPYCQLIGKYDFISGKHLEKCPDLVIDCPNNCCHVKVKRSKMSEHKQVCPKEVIECRHAAIGCPVKRKREEMDEHLNTATEEHLERATKKIKALEEKQNICPFVVKLEKFSDHKASGGQWQSPGFYTSPGGYRLHLVVLPNGLGNSKDQYVTCYIVVTRGENSSLLEWPFRGRIKLELLNQRCDSFHLSSEGQIHSSKGLVFFPNFVSHSNVNPNGSCSTQYIKDDSLFFRITVSVTSATKSWLVN